MNKMTGIILMLAGSILFLSGFIIFRLPQKADKPSTIQAKIDPQTDSIVTDGVLTKNEKEKVKKLAPEKSPGYEETKSGTEHQRKSGENKAETDLMDGNKKKGDDFEKYIVQKFDKKYFKIKEWTGDKFVNGQYAENTLNPDILMEIKWKGKTGSFAVECKWRKGLYNNGIEFTYTDQLERYRAYEREKKVPVFIALGQGGLSSDPEHLYIIPLKEIKSTYLELDFLKSYEKEKGENFYFEADTGELR